ISISPKNYHFSSLDWAFKLICEKSGNYTDRLVGVVHLPPMIGIENFIILLATIYGWQSIQ
ncbi:MAG: hypothetical protein MK111_26655, partial [Crocosphaera sp.]|uniref:hypothetical protein n=1 Tax=Crocosphaera sp. TaxID=2729996 RepID=UPI00258517B3